LQNGRRSRYFFTETLARSSPSMFESWLRTAIAVTSRCLVCDHRLGKRSDLILADVSRWWLFSSAC
jgi:hypothetical protein